MNTIPKWGPRLARLYSLDMKALEKRHAAAIAPGTTNWADAVEALYLRVHAIGPVKGAKLLGQAAEYLNGFDSDEQAHLVLSWGVRKRSAHLIFATFSVGAHPDPRVREEGLNIEMHLVECRRSSPRCATGMAVAFLSNHTLKRLFERSDFDNAQATAVVAYISTLGYLTRFGPRHKGGGMNLLVGGSSRLLVTGAMNVFQRAHKNGRTINETVFDVRTILEVDGCGPERLPQLEQGSAAAKAVTDWFAADADDLDEVALAASIPVLPSRESYPARVAQSN